MFERVSTLSLLLLCFTFATLFPSPSAAQEREVLRGSLEPYRFEPHDGEPVDAELGRFRVPLDRVAAPGDSLQLVFVRFPATTSTPGPPIVYLAGGPGGSGVATARGSRLSMFMALREHGDVIAFDQRGTGMSEGPSPAECPITHSYPASRPLQLDELRRLTLEVARDCGEFWRERGVELSAYDTVESADDIAALAASIGAERIRLWGISYGTHLGLTVIRRHPQLVERAILAGIEGPDHTVKLPSYSATQLRRLEELIAARPEVSRRFPDLRGIMRRVLERLEQEPVSIEIFSADMRDTIRSKVSAFQVRARTVELLRDPSSLVRVPYLYERMAAGDFSVIAGSPPELGGLAAMPEATDAASGMSAQRRARYQREERNTLLGGGDAIIGADMAEALCVPDLGEDFRAPVRSSVPVLFISGTLDGRTPLANAEEVLRGFPNGQHLVIENAGHSDPLFLSSPRILETMRAFLRGRSLPTTRVRTAPPDLAEGALPPALSADFLQSIVGGYERRRGDVWRVLHHRTVRSLDPGGHETGRTTELLLRLRGNGFPLQARPDSTFFIPGFGPDLVFRFHRDAAGAVERLEFARPGSDSAILDPVDWKEVGFVEAQTWEVAGPYQLGADQSCDRLFDPERSPGRVDWRTAEGDDGMVDFEESLGGSLAGGVGYARMRIEVDAETRAELRMGSDDDLRVFLDGEPIHSFDGSRSAWETQDHVPVEFGAGTHVLLVKVCNRDSDWGFTLRITDQRGRSLIAQRGRGRVHVEPWVMDR